MEINIPSGITNRIEHIVRNNDTAEQYGSGIAQVFATPALVALMEQTAYKSIEPYLPVGWSSVGTEIEVKHLKATLPGDTVYAISKLVSVEGRCIEFDISAFASKGLIGIAKHRRFLVDTERFMTKLSD